MEKGLLGFPLGGNPFDPGGLDRLNPPGLGHIDPNPYASRSGGFGGVGNGAMGLPRDELILAAVLGGDVTSVTGTTPATAHTVASFPDLVLDNEAISVLALPATIRSGAAGQTLNLGAFDFDTCVGFLGQWVVAPTTAYWREAARWSAIPSTGIHRYSVRVWVSSGTGTYFSTSCYMVVKDYDVRY